MVQPSKGHIQLESTQSHHASIYISSQERNRQANETKKAQAAKKRLRRKAKKALPARRQRVARVERRTRARARQRGTLGPVRWWLVKQTTIKPKWYLRDAFEAEVRRVPAALGDVLSSALEGVP